MILKGKQRADPVALGRYLVSMRENDQVEVLEVKGFLSQDVVGAMQEIQLASLNLSSKAKQPVFSLSMSPPKDQIVGDDVFQKAADDIEQKLGLCGQSRVIVMHEPRGGGRHAHVVWSRIDADKNTLKQLSHYKLKLQDMSRGLFLEHGWSLPNGLVSSKNRDPRNFSFAEYQAAKRRGDDIRELTDSAREAWSVSKNGVEFSAELEKRGLFLGRGDRAYVVMTIDQNVYSLPRLLGCRTKDVRERLGRIEEIRSLDETRDHISKVMTPAFARHMDEVRSDTAEKLERFDDIRRELNLRHKKERALLDAGQVARADSEARDRAARLPRGVKAIFSWISGRYAQIRESNEHDAYQCLVRDRNQRANLVSMQMADSDALRAEVQTIKRSAAKRLRALYATGARLSSNRQVPRQQAHGLNSYRR